VYLLLLTSCSFTNWNIVTSIDENKISCAWGPVGGVSEASSKTTPYRRGLLLFLVHVHFSNAVWSIGSSDAAKTEQQQFVYFSAGGAVEFFEEAFKPRYCIFVIFWHIGIVLFLWCWHDRNISVNYYPSFVIFMYQFLVNVWEVLLFVRHLPITCIFSLVGQSLLWPSIAWFL